MKKNKKKTKILFVATFPPPVHGSAMMSKYIKKSNLINEAFDCDYINLSTSRRMDEIGKKNISKFFRFVKSYLCLLCKLMTNRYALCYLAITCHGLGFIKDVPFVLLCKFFRRKIVIHQHNKGMSKDVNRQPYKWLLPLVYKNTKVILLSWYLYDDISPVVKKEDVFICPNGIPETFKEEPHFERNNEIPHILFLSNLIESKGVYVLLDALKILKDKGYNFICDFVGGESKEIDTKKINEEVQKRGLNNLTIYHGEKYGIDKEDFWNKADLLVFPTFYDNECFPLVLLEAMQHNITCISTDEGGIPEIIEDQVTGYIVGRRDILALADKLAYLIDHREQCRKMGCKGREKFNREFSLERFEKRMLNLLSQIIKIN